LTTPAQYVSAYGLIVSVADFVTTSVPLINGFVTVVTVAVVIGKVAVLDPAGTVTVGGTDAATLLLESDTVNPPAPASAVSVTVPTEPVPPVTVAGETLSDESITGGVERPAACHPCPWAIPVQ
jgi:hypothetical protein